MTKWRNRSCCFYLVIILLCLFMSPELNAQYGKRANYWYFGGGIGLHFEPGGPVLLNDSRMRTIEGCASMSDENGNLQIYSDGDAIWNRKHQIIPGATGLGGHLSATQSATIIPKPGDKDMLYVFSIGAYEAVRGLHYSVIDMRGNGGLGSLVSKRNPLLGDEATEQLTAVPHCNRRDYWIISQDRNFNFYVWLLTPRGISGPPAKFHFPGIKQGGNFKASFDGKLLAAGGKEVHLYSFDNSSGAISHIHSFRLPVKRGKKIDAIYGLEFSPQNRFLYAAHSEGGVYQIDLIDTSPAKLEASTVQISTADSTTNYFGVQLGPNKKIYVVCLGTKIPYLSVIAEPEKKGLDCAYMDDVLDLGDFTVNLPNFTPLDLTDVIYEAKLAYLIHPCEGYAELYADVIPTPPSYSLEWYKDGKALSETGSKIIVKASGTYQVRFTILEGRADSTAGLVVNRSVEIQLPPPLRFDSLEISATLCSGDGGVLTVNISGGHPPYRYSLDGKSTMSSNHFTNISAGKHRITLTDSLGCEKDTIFEVPQSDGPILELSQKFDANCNEENGAVELSARNGLAPYQYSKDAVNYSPSQVFEHLPPGTYTFYVRDKNGCLDSLSVEIVQLEGVRISEVETSPTGCAEPSGEAVVHAASSALPLMYSIGGANFQSDSIFRGLKEGDYEITVKDQNGCIQKQRFVIRKSDVPKLLFSNMKKARCGADNGSISLQGIKGVPPYQYTLDGGIPGTNTTFNNLKPGMHHIRITDSRGCSSDTTIEIIAIPSPMLSPTSILPCYCEQNNGSVTLSVQGGTAPFSYSLDGNSFTANPKFQSLAPGPYTAYIRDANGCLDSVQFEIPSIPGVKIINTTTEDASCMQNNGKLRVMVRNGKELRFSIDGTHFQKDSLFTHLAPGDYTLTVMDANGCSDSKMIHISSSGEEFVQSLQIEEARCGLANGTLDIQGSKGGLRYSLDGVQFSEKSHFDSLREGDYLLYIRDENGCETQKEFYIPGSPPVEILHIAITPSECYSPTGTARVEVGGGSGEILFSLDGETFHTGEYFQNLSGGEHQIRIKDNKECSDEQPFEIAKTGCKFYIPNTFTPNKDEINDVFRIYPHEGFKGTIASIEIFDRWGNKLYQSKEGKAEDVGWDGSFKGKEVNPGVFVYLLKVKQENGQILQFYGSVTLIR